MKTKTHFQFRLDLCDVDGDALEHIGGTDDSEVAKATYKAALRRWPNSRVILRQGDRTVHDSGPRSVIA